MFVEEILSHHLIAILKEIVRRLAGCTILSRLLVGRAHTLPRLNGISHVGRDGHIELAFHLVGWNPQIAKFFCRFDLAPLFIIHLRCPFAADAPDAQTSNLIGTMSCCDPDKTRRSKVRKGVLWTSLECMQFVLRERTGCPDQLEPAIFLNILRIWLNGSSHIIRHFACFVGYPCQLEFRVEPALHGICSPLQVGKEGPDGLETRTDR